MNKEETYAYLNAKGKKPFLSNDHLIWIISYSVIKVSKEWRGATWKTYIYRII